MAFDCFLIISQFPHVLGHRLVFGPGQQGCEDVGLQRIEREARRRVPRIPDEGILDESGAMPLPTVKGPFPGERFARGLDIDPLFLHISP